MSAPTLRTYNPPSNSRMYGFRVLQQIGDIGVWLAETEERGGGNAYLVEVTTQKHGWLQESCDSLGSRGRIREAFSGKGRARKKVFSSHRLSLQVDGSEDHKIPVQGLAIDFLKKGTVDWKGGVWVDSGWQSGTRRRR